MPRLKALLSLFKNIHIQSLIGNAVMAVVGIGTMAILYRALPVDQMGEYLFFIVVFTLIDSVKSGILTGSFLKFYSGTAKDRAREVAGSAWVLALIISVALMGANVITFFVAPFVKGEGTIILLKYFSLVMLTTLPSFMTNIAVQGEKRFDRLLWMRLINQLSYILLIALEIVFKRATLENVLWAYAISNALASVATILLGWSEIGAIGHATRKTVLELFHFGKYSMGTSLSANLYGVTDTFFIKVFLGPAALAVYNLGIKFVQIIEIPMLSFAASGMPAMASYYNNDQYDNMMNLMKKMAGMLTLAFMAIALVSLAMAEPVVRIFGGEKYVHTEAPNLLRIVITIGALYPIDRFFAMGLDVIHKPKINFYKVLLMLSINLVGDLVGVTVFKSVYAVALINVFPVLVAIIVAYVPLNKFYPFRIRDLFTMGFAEIIKLIKQARQGLTGLSKV